jgi:SRSO17 transposase
MERRFQLRLDELRADAHVPASLLDTWRPQLAAFLTPFVAALTTPEYRVHTQTYLTGLISDLPSKDAESIAYLHNHERQGLQKFLGQVPWDHRPLLDELTRQVATDIGRADAVLVCDPSAFPKKGPKSVGVQRQWCGRLGKVDNCQVGLYLGYVSEAEHALVDFRLYLPREWTQDRARSREAGIPPRTRFQTRHQLFLAMLDQRGPQLPHAWISGDDEMGRCSWFRQELQARGENYLLAVPSNTTIRDWAGSCPRSPEIGRPRKPAFQQVDRWRATVPESSWETIEVRPGERGPLSVQVITTLVQARTEGSPSAVAELLVVVRDQQSDGTWKHDYLLSNAAVMTSRAELMRVFKAQHRIEDCLQRAKGEAGLGDYQVRTWIGWHHHQALSLVATWFLTQTTRGGKKGDPRIDGACGANVARRFGERRVGSRGVRASSANRQSTSTSQRRGPTLFLETSQPLATTTSYTQARTDTVELVTGGRNK